MLTITLAVDPIWVPIIYFVVFAAVVGSLKGLDFDWDLSILYGIFWPLVLAVAIIALATSPIWGFYWWLFAKMDF